MTPENSNPQATQQPDRLRTVTPLSKYLAMALFVSLPFIGGWVGYSHAPSKEVVVEKIVFTETTASDTGSTQSQPTYSTSTLLKRNLTYYRSGLPTDYIGLLGTSSYPTQQYAFNEDGFFMNEEMIFSSSDNSYQKYGSYYFRIKDSFYSTSMLPADEEGGDVKIITDEVDPATFEVLQEGYAKDKTSVFFLGKLLTVRSDNFRLVEYPSNFNGGETLVLGIDISNVYFEGEKLLGLDPKTFKVAPGAETIYDEDTTYSRVDAQYNFWYTL